MLWRFSANNTHLYPGAFLRCLDTASEMNLKEGDELLLEFSDGVTVNGQCAARRRGSCDAAIACLSDRAWDGCG